MLNRVAADSVAQENFIGYATGDAHATQATDSALKKICETVLAGTAAAGAVGAALIMIGLAIMAIAAAGAPETLGTSAILALPGCGMLVIGVVIALNAGALALLTEAILIWFG